LTISLSLSTTNKHNKQTIFNTTFFENHIPNSTFAA
jgi:hypothetical protein